MVLYLDVHEKITKMACPRCSSERISNSGGYNIKRTKFKILRFRCLDCNKSFVFKNIQYRKRISFRIKKNIVKLYSTRKPVVNKYDNKKSDTYSTREVAKIVGLSKSYVHKVVSESA